MAFFRVTKTLLFSLLSTSLLLHASAYDLADVLAGYNLQSDSSAGLGFHPNETDFNIMADMLLVVGLAGMDASQVETECTIFAPSDESFYRTARDLGLNASSKFDLYRSFLLYLSERYEDPIGTLRKQLLFHVLPQKLRVFPHDSLNGTQEDVLDALLRERGIYRVNMTLVDPNPNLPDPNVIFALSNVEVSSCYIHVIDRLLFTESLVTSMEPYPSMEPSMAPEPTMEVAVESPYELEPSLEMYATVSAEEIFEPFSISKSAPVALYPTVGMIATTPEPSFSPTLSLMDMEESASSAPLPSWDVASPSMFALYTPVQSSGFLNEENEYYLPTPAVSPLPVAGNELGLSLGNETPDELEVFPSQNPGSKETPTVSIDETTSTFTEHARPNLFAAPEETLIPYIYEEESSPSPEGLVDTSPLPAFSHEVLTMENLVASETNGPGLLPSEQLFISAEDIADGYPIVEESGEANFTPDANFPAPEASPESGNAECFPLSANFHLPTGEAVKFGQLGTGFDILATESSTSRIYLFTHRKTTGMHDFVRIQSNKNHSINLSQGHYIYANNKLKAAGHVQVGDTLRTLDGSAIVTSVEWAKDYGLMAPHTLHGDIVVNRVVVSTYTSAVNPKLAHALLWPLRVLVKIGATEEPIGSLLYHGLPEFVPRICRFIRILTLRAH